MSSSTGRSVRVATYFRNSTDKNEKSIERQESEVNPYVEARGYHVVEVCRDENISGSEVEKRKGLQRILQLAREGRIDGIVCDDIDRFSRLNAFKFAVLVDPLRDAGIWIEAVSTGRIDYESMAGRLMIAITSEAKHAQSVDTSRRTITKLVHMARDLDTPPLPNSPYGYRREEDLSKPLDKFGKRPGKLVVVEHEAEVVRQIFEWFVNGRSPRWISNELHRRSILSPKGGPFWSRCTITRMIRNPVYVGDACWGKVSVGKYHRHQSGKIVAGNGKRLQRLNPTEDWRIVRDYWPSIIQNRDVWIRAQSLLKEMGVGEIVSAEGEPIRRKGRASTPSVDPGKFLLSRLLVCASCGSWYQGKLWKQRRTPPSYVCGKYNEQGPKACGRCEVIEPEIVTAVIERLRLMLSSDNLAWLKEQLRRRLREMRSDANLNRLKKQAKELKAKHQSLKERLAIVPKDMIDVIAEQIRENRVQADRVQAELDEAQETNPVYELESIVEAASSVIWTLDKAMEDKDRIALRDALRGIIEKIVIHPSPCEEDNGNRKLTPGRIEVHLKQGSGLELLPDLKRTGTGTNQVLYIDLAACA